MLYMRDEAQAAVLQRMLMAGGKIRETASGSLNGRAGEDWAHRDDARSWSRWLKLRGDDHAGPQAWTGL